MLSRLQTELDAQISEYMGRYNVWIGVDEAQVADSDYSYDLLRIPVTREQRAATSQESQYILPLSFLPIIFICVDHCCIT